MTSFKIKSLSNHVSLCQRVGCGNGGLSSTVALTVLDEQRDELGVTYYDVDCAAEVLRLTPAEVEDKAATADRYWDRRREWARTMIDTYGPLENASSEAKTKLFYQRNPTHRFTSVDPVTEIASLLADARAILSR